MDTGLNGRVALVAASSRGLGRAIAEEFAAEGASLILCARDERVLRRTAEAIGSKVGVPVLAVPADLTDPEQVRVVAEAGVAEYDRIDVLVTNTGGPPSGPFESHSPAVWHAAVRQNLDSVVNLTRAVLPGMRRRRWGRIINITSIAVKQPVDNLILSNSVRAAVTGFARSLANEVAAEGVTVNNVMPGYTRTERLKELAARLAADEGGERNVYARWEREIPMARLGEPEEIAALVVFLASTRAAYITGSSIAVDGGWVRALL
jgi:3-oxoacyl-[acyl-carrier protein] reductase